jgi:hypothetical protein
MSSVGAARSAAVSVSSARAAASRKNGARSRGPKTAEGKARSARNALKHGLRAQKHVVLPEEDGGEFKALLAAFIAELAPVGALQAVLAQRIAVAAWRLMRADRIEAEVLGHQQRGDGDLGLAAIRDCYGAGALATLLRYRSGALAEFTRSLRALKALQAESRAQAAAAAEARAPAPAPVRLAAARSDRHPKRPTAPATQPNEPKRRGDSCDRGRPAAPAHPDVTPAGVWSVPLPMPGGPALRELEGAVPEIRMAQGMDVGVTGKRVP